MRINRRIIAGVYVKEFIRSGDVIAKSAVTSVAAGIGDVAILLDSVGSDTTSNTNANSSKTKSNKHINNTSSNNNLTTTAIMKHS